MINFIVVDDVEKYVVNTVNIIDKIMMNSKLEYKIHTFNDYNSKFTKVAKEPLPNKVYILDIETPTASGVDMARAIRKTDMTSVIIFMTAYDGLGMLVAKNQLLALNLVSKFDNYEQTLRESIVKSLEVLGLRKMIIVQEYSSIYYVPLNDIVYIVKDSFDRKAVIKTNNNEYRVNKTLKELKELVGDVFVQTHRACLVNQERVRHIDKKNNIVHFDNGDSIDFVSYGYKKELV